MFFFFFLLPASFSARKLPALCLGGWRLLWGVCVRESYLCSLTTDVLTGNRACPQKRYGGRDFLREVGWIKLATCILLGFCYVIPIPEFRHGNEESIFFFIIKALFGTIFCHYFFLLYWLSREEPRTSGLLGHKLGLAPNIWPSDNERHICLGRGVFFSTRQCKIYMMINKKISPDELRSLLSQTMLSVIFTPYPLIPFYFPSASSEVTIVGHNIAGNSFTLGLLFVFHLFVYVHGVWVESCRKRGRGWAITMLMRLGKPQFFSPSFPLSKTESNEKVRNTQFLCKVFLSCLGKGCALCFVDSDCVLRWVSREAGLRWP